MNLEEAAARLAAGKHILTTVPVSGPIFRNTLHRLLELSRQFELLPSLSPDLLHTLIDLPPKPGWRKPTTKGNLPGPGFSGGIALLSGTKSPLPLLSAGRGALRPLFSQGSGKGPFVRAAARSRLWPFLLLNPGNGCYTAAFAPSSGLLPVETCVFCGTEADQQFSYVFVEDDPARRADLCRTCHRYLKTIVAGRLTHLLYLPLEEFVTVDLDTLVARDDLIS